MYVLEAASAWSLGQIGRHSPDHARALAEVIIKCFIIIIINII